MTLQLAIWHDFFAALQSFNFTLRSTVNRCDGADPVRIPYELYIPLWHPCNAEKVARHREQTRAEIAAGTYRHREQQQQAGCRRELPSGAHVGRTPIDVVHTYVRSCVPRVITGFRRGNAPAMADPPAYSRGRIQAFGHSGDATGTQCVPVTPLVSTPIKHPLVKENEGGRARDARGLRHRPIPCDSLAVARDALPGVITTCHCHPRDGGFEKMHVPQRARETDVGRERQRRARREDARIAPNWFGVRLRRVSQGVAPRGWLSFPYFRNQWEQDQFAE